MADKTYKIQATLSNGSTIETGTFVVPQGPTGESAGFGTPTVSTTTGNPGTNASVTVTTNASTPNTAKVFNFAFTIPRGNTGVTGLAALEYSQIQSFSVEPETEDTFTIQTSYCNRTPVVGDKFLCNIHGYETVAGRSWIAGCTVYSDGGTLKGQIKSLTETTGATGPTGPQVSTYRTTVSGKNISGVASNMVFYTTTSPASGWHIVIDDGEL